MARNKIALVGAGQIGGTLALLAGLKELGVAPKPIELFLDRWMVRYRKHGRFGTRISAARR